MTKASEIAARKFLSVRAIVTIAVIITLCLLVFKCIDLLTESVKDQEQFERIKDIVMFILGAFTSVVTMATTAYFNRSDRWKEKDENEQEKQGGQQ